MVYNLHMNNFECKKLKQNYICGYGENVLNTLF
jgi:hypothetical protein